MRRCHERLAVGKGRGGKLDVDVDGVRNRKVEIYNKSERSGEERESF